MVVPNGFEMPPEMSVDAGFVPALFVQRQCAPFSCAGACGSISLGNGIVDGVSCDDSIVELFGQPLLSISCLRNALSISQGQDVFPRHLVAVTNIRVISAAHLALHCLRRMQMIRS